jgi:hypothetical protein
MVYVLWRFAACAASSVFFCCACVASFHLEQPSLICNSHRAWCGHNTLTQSIPLALFLGSLNSVGHEVHCPLSSCKNILWEGTQLVIILRISHFPKPPLPHYPSSHHHSSLRDRKSSTMQHEAVAVASASGVLFLLRNSLRRCTVSLAMFDTLRKSFAPAPSPTILAVKLEACSTPSRYESWVEPARRLAARA